MSIKIKIAPSILSADFGKMAEEIIILEKAGADLIHCDVMDGVFVDNITFGPKLIADIRSATKLPLDTHLMIVNPVKYIDKFIKAGSDAVTIHCEADDKPFQTLKAIKDSGCKCGIAISPDTPIENIKNLLDITDIILVMSVYPGFGGQQFIPRIMKKIFDIRQLIQKSGRSIDLQVDGGVTFENVKEIIASGANVIIAGNTVFKAADRAEAIKTLRQY